MKSTTQVNRLTPSPLRCNYSSESQCCFYRKVNVSKLLACWRSLFDSPTQLKKKLKGSLSLWIMTACSLHSVCLPSWYPSTVTDGFQSLSFTYSHATVKHVKGLLSTGVYYYILFIHFHLCPSYAQTFLRACFPLTGNNESAIVISKVNLFKKEMYLFIRMCFSHLIQIHKKQQLLNNYSNIVLPLL